MRLGAQAVELGEGTRTREIYGEATIHERHRHRYEVNNQFRDQLVEQRARRLGHLPGRPARRDRRAARSSLVRREPVPPGVQVAPDAAGAALPRLRRRSARTGAGSAAPSPSRPHAERRPRPLSRARRDPEPTRRGACGRRPRARRARRHRARVGRGRSRARSVGSTMGNILCRLPGRGGRRDADLPLCASRHGACRPGRSSPSSRTASSGTPAARSSAPTTSRPSR